MPDGDTALLGGLSYVAVGRETTVGTYNTCSAALDAISCSMAVTQENKIIEQIERTRTYSKRIQQMKMVGGGISFYYAPDVLACNYLLQNAFFGTVTTATVTGETTGGGGLQHTFEIGNVEQSYPSLCLNVRKGPATSGRVFEYSGVKVSEIAFSAAIDEPLKCDATFVAMDATQTSNDVVSALTVTSAELLSFTNGRFSIEQTFASLTSSSFWHVQSAEFGWNNDIKSDAAAGRIGSALRTVLPLGALQFNLKCSMRFNTTTAFDAMIAASALSCQLEFLGSTISGSVARRGIRFNFPRVYITNAGDPTINGPNEILTSDIEFHVMRDDSSATGYAMQALVYNTTTSFA
jgi:hypothetical protein